MGFRKYTFVLQNMNLKKEFKINHRQRWRRMRIFVKKQQNFMFRSELMIFLNNSEQKKNRQIGQYSITCVTFSSLVG